LKPETENNGKLRILNSKALLINYFKIPELNQIEMKESYRQRLCIFLSLLIMYTISYSQENSKVNTELLSKAWDASWISPPSASLREYGVFHFRKSFELDAKPDEFIINVSADNRYRLFVNGNAVCSGPARGDMEHWRFETIDISQWLVKGKNVITATVWNFGEFMPWAQISYETSFILQGNSDKESLVDSGPSWKVLQDKSYSPLNNFSKLNTFIVVGPGDQVNGEAYPWGWESVDFDDSKWIQAVDVTIGQPRGVGTDIFWVLEPRSIPLMEESLKRMSRIRRAEGILPDDGFLKGNKDLTIPAHSQISLLIDQDYLTTAYPELLVSGGKGSNIHLEYAEALFRMDIQAKDPSPHKGNRNEIENSVMLGFEDVFLPDGGNKRLFRPLWFRTYRYIELKVRTSDEALVIHDIHGMYTGYPFQEKGSFSSDDPKLSKIWEVGWRTARLCANETYFDCPYYEQLQYVGDTRIQSLISLYVGGDDRLMKNAISLFNCSRSSEGITMSRYPTNNHQVIPPFSLFWINMVHDLWMHRDDKAFVRSMLPGIESVLWWYGNKLDAKSGMLGKVAFWNFVDWPDEWPWDPKVGSGGVPPGGASGGSSILSMQLAYTLRDAAELEKSLGKPELGREYELLAHQICDSTFRLCWDSSRELLADSPDKKSFSQHANIMGLISDAIPITKQLAVYNKINQDKNLVQTTLYYKFYLVRAMKKVGMADQYLDILGPWQKTIENGFTTFPERPENTRSDCHAWSASPIYDLLATVCGIEPSSPGFKTVKIEPHPGHLSVLDASFPHPLGEIGLHLKKSFNGSWRGEIILPKGLTGTFRLSGKTINLKEGSQKISLN
jgi:alpha-L-rhamnosidase